MVNHHDKPTVWQKMFGTFSNHLISKSKYLSWRHLAVVYIYMYIYISTSVLNGSKPATSSASTSKISSFFRSQVRHYLADLRRFTLREKEMLGIGKKYVPGTQMTSIFEGQPTKTRPFPIKTRVIWVPGWKWKIIRLACWVYSRKIRCFSYCHVEKRDYIY